MGVNFSQDIPDAAIVSIDGKRYNFFLDPNTGLSLPRGSLDRVGDTREHVSAILTQTDSTHLPPEATVSIPDGRTIILQEWLAQQPPPEEFTQAGGEVFDDTYPYIPKEHNTDTMKCWQYGGIWYWNRRGEVWLASHYNATIASQGDIRKLYATQTGQPKTTPLDSYTIPRRGIFDANTGEIRNSDRGFIRTNTKEYGGNSNVLLAAGRGKTISSYASNNTDGVIPYLIIGS